MLEADSSSLSLSALYAQLSPELERIVSANIRADAALLEEACQIAWAGLVANRDRLVPGTELGWLATTATREALKLARTERRELSLDAEEEAEGELLELALTPEPQQVIELRERLAEVRQLPARQQRLVMLHGFGYRYEEIALVTGESRRTVERQLLRAKRRLACLRQAAVASER